MSRTATSRTEALVDFKALLTHSGHTQTSLAMAIGSSPATISLIANHRYVPTRGIRKRIALALGVVPTDIWPNHEEDD